MNNNFTPSLTPDPFKFVSNYPTYEEGESNMPANKSFLPNPVTPTLDFAHESKEHFIAFLKEIEVLIVRPWAADWIRTYWSDKSISDYMANGYDGLSDYEILEHMSEWLKYEEITRGKLIY